MKKLFHKTSDYIKDKDTISKPVTSKMHFDSDKSTKTFFGGFISIFRLLLIISIGMVKFISVYYKEKIYLKIKHEDYDGKDIHVSVLKESFPVFGFTESIIDPKFGWFKE